MQRRLFAFSAAVLLTQFSLSAFAESNPSIQQSSYLDLSKSDEADTLSKDLKTELTFSMTGRRYDDAIVNSRWGRAAVGIDLVKKFNDFFSGRISAEQRFTSGASSNFYSVTEGSASPSSTLIDEASLTAKAGSYLKGTAGIVPVGLNPIYSVMSTQSWLAAKVQSDIALGEHKMSLVAAQATPSSGGVSNRAVDNGALPLFTEGTLLGELNPTDRIRLRAAYTQYIFTDPSARTAEDSKFNGSTVLGNGPYLFAYDFAGHEVAADTRFTLFLDDQLTFRYAEALNDKAPKGVNKGTGWRVEYAKKFNRFEVVGAVNGFRVESDVIPSTYGIEFSGFANRIGNGLSLKVMMPKQKIGFMAGYAKAKVLNTEATAAGTQADRDVYTLKTEIAYDIF